MNQETRKKINLLKTYLVGRDDVVMAFVFGSRAGDRAVAVSDWDIGVYFKSEKGVVEWEETGRLYPAEDHLWGDCIDILKTDQVDLVVLNRAPASIAAAALRGIPLVVKDRWLWLEFILRVTRESEDFAEFVKEYAAIRERSRSLTPSDAARLLRMISFLEEQTALYAYFREFTPKAYEQNVHQRNEVERWIENIVNGVIDIAKIILASEKRPIPETYRSAVQQAIWKLQLSKDFEEHFEHWVKLRNVLAHEYLDIKWQRIAAFIAQSEPSVSGFILATKKFTVTSAS